MWGAWVWVGVALLLAACDGGPGRGRAPNTLPPPVETTTTAAVDYSVPAVIDAAYVEKVMAALDRVYGDAIRTLAVERRITEEFLSRLAAIYTAEEFKFAQGVWVRDVANGLPGLLPTPGDPRTKVQTMVAATPNCVVASVLRNFAATRTTPDQPTPQWYVALVPREPIGPRYNPTPWVISFDGFKDGGQQPERPCDR